MRSPLPLLSALACISSFPMCAIAAAEDYTQWAHSRELALNTSATGASITVDQIGFPVLISLSAQQSDVFDEAQAGGADMRFSTMAGAHLAYQIEAWDKAAIWVRVDTVKAGKAAQGLRMHWGKTGAPDSSDGKSVFPAANGFQGVWHLGNSVDDASGAAHNGVDSGTVAAADGRIGTARYFDNPDAYVKNTGKYIALGNPADMNLAGRITMEAWVKWIKRDQHRIILCHGAATGVNFETVLRIGETLDYRAGTWTTAAHYATLVTPLADSNAWVHLAGVYSGTAWTLYRNGVMVSELADTNGAKPTTGNWRIGAEYASTSATMGSVTRFFHGWMDEVRLSGVARSADWIKLGYENQKEGQTLVTIGPTVTAVAGRTAGAKPKRGLSQGFTRRKILYAIPDKDERTDAIGVRAP